MTKPSRGSKTMDINCTGYVGHRWSENPARRGFHIWCIRCHTLYAPPVVIQPVPEPTSILNGKAIPKHLVVGPDPDLDWHDEDMTDIDGVWVINPGANRLLIDANTLSDAKPKPSKQDDLVA